MRGARAVAGVEVRVRIRSADRNMNPCSLDGTDQRARTVLAACVEPDGPVDANGEQALVIDDARHPVFLSGGEAARPWDAATGARVRRPRLRRCSWRCLRRSLLIGQLYLRDRGGNDGLAPGTLEQ